MTIIEKGHINLWSGEVTSVFRVVDPRTQKVLAIFSSYEAAKRYVSVSNPTAVRYGL
jgi:hypothetical protein